MPTPFIMDTLQLTKRVLAARQIVLNITFYNYSMELFRLVVRGQDTLVLHVLQTYQQTLLTSKERLQSQFQYITTNEDFIALTKRVKDLEKNIARNDKVIELMIENAKYGTGVFTLYDVKTLDVIEATPDNPFCIGEPTDKLMDVVRIAAMTENNTL